MRRTLLLFLALMLTLLPLSALAQADDDPAADAIITFVKTALDIRSMTYTLEDGNCFVLTYDASDGRMGDIIACLDVYSEGVLILACYHETVPLDKVDEIARFMNMVNGEVLGTKYFLSTESGTIFYELLYFLNPENLGDYELTTLLDFLDSVVADVDYDTEYFMEIIHGESAENVFAMFQADYYSD